MGLKSLAKSVTSSVSSAVQSVAAPVVNTVSSVAKGDIKGAASGLVSAAGMPVAYTNDAIKSTSVGEEFFNFFDSFTGGKLSTLDSASRGNLTAAAQVGQTVGAAYTGGALTSGGFGLPESLNFQDVFNSDIFKGLANKALGLMDPKAGVQASGSPVSTSTGYQATPNQGNMNTILLLGLGAVAVGGVVYLAARK